MKWVSLYFVNFIDGTDYATITQTLAVTIPAGPAGEYCIDTTINDDNIALEGNETFVFRFENLPNGVSMGSTPESSVQILDNDGKLYA